MGNWWKISKLEIKLALKDREAFVWSFIAPILFTAFIAVAFNGGSSEPGPIRAAYDNGKNPPYVEKIFKDFLAKENIALAEGKNLPVISVPDSLVQKMLDGRKAEVTIRVSEESRSARAVSAKIRKLLYFLAFRVQPDWLDDPPSAAELDSLLAQSGPIRLKRATLGIAPRNPSSFERTFPSIVVMFLLFSLFTFYAGLWVEDIRTGKIRRIILSPTGMKDLFLAQVSSRMLWSVLQVVVVGMTATLLFRIEWELPVLATAALLLVYMGAATALGMLFGTFFDNPEKATGLGVIVSLVLAALGGCWWPLEIVPGPMKIAALFTPTGLTMDAFGEFIAYGRHAAFPLPNILGLAAMGLIAMPLAIKRMKKQLIS
jgi:ABC-type multidrug transport system permease subunit